MSIKADAMIITGGVALLVLGAWYASKKAGQVVDAALPYVNPMDSRNLAYQGVNGIGGAITGEQGWTLGGAVYDFDQYIDGLLGLVPKAPSYTIAPDFGVTNPGSWD